MGVGISFFGFACSLIVSPFVRRLYTQASKPGNIGFRILWILFWFIEKLFYYIIGFGGVTFWRGIWYFWDKYILTNDITASAWLSHAIGFGCLTLLFASKSVLAPPLLPLLDGGKETSFSLPLPRYGESDPCILFTSMCASTTSNPKRKTEDELSSRNLSEIV